MLSKHLEPLGYIATPLKSKKIETNICHTAFCKEIIKTV